MLATIETGYRARPQFAAFHARRQRFAVMVCHRRAGKTVASIHDLQDAALRCQLTRPRFAYLAPFLKQSKTVAWDYLREAMAPLRVLGAETNESELRVDYHNGGQVRLYGADNPDALRGIYLDGVVLDEYADMDPRVWAEIIRPALADRKGWAVFIGTPKGRNAFHELWVRSQTDMTWYSLMLKASDTGIVSSDELALAAKDLTSEQYAQEFECSFDAAIRGAYYGREINQAEAEGRIRDVPHEPELPVYTAWDLGWGDSTSIWFFQVAGAEVRVIDHYENHGYGLDHYLTVLKKRGYGYAVDFVPHDAKVHELIAGRTRVEYLSDLGRDLRVIGRHKVEDGINAGRLLLARCVFDAAKCAYGLDALRQYQTEFDEKTKAFKDSPRHDWTCHAADAWRYLAMGWREMDRPEAKPDPIAELLKPRTWNDVIEAHEWENRDD
jgi:hypothetical protein